MNTSDALVAYLAEHSGDEWLDHSDAYQYLLEECGLDIYPLLLDLLDHHDPDIRGTCVALLATRRPHGIEAVEAIRPLVHDPHPLVRSRTWEALKEFGSLASCMTEEALRVIQEDYRSEDQYPRVAAIGFLLRLDEDLYSPVLVPHLRELLDRGSDSVGFVLATLMTMKGVTITYED